MTISITESNIFASVRALIAAVIPGVEVVRGLDNSVPMPLGPFISMQPLMASRLSTNLTSYADPTPLTGSESMEEHKDFCIQLDFYGPDSTDWAAQISAIWRSEYACNMLAPMVAPLYADDAKQIPIVDGEQNFEQRWMVEAHLQYNPVVTVPMQFFTTVTVNPVDVDSKFK